MPISNTTTDSYSYYPGVNGYPFFETGTWNTPSSEALPYFGNYGQEYMPFPSSYDYAPAMWSSCPNGYSSWDTSSQVDPAKVDSQQLTMMTYAPTDYYQSNSNSNSQQQAETNGIDAAGLTSTVVNGIDTDDIDRGIHHLSINGNGDVTTSTHETTSDLTIPESNPVTIVNTSASKTVIPSTRPAGKPMSWANIASQPAKPVPKPVQIVNKLQQAKPAASSNIENGMSEKATPTKTAATHQASRGAWQAPRTHRASNGVLAHSEAANHKPASDVASDPTLTRLKQTNTYNPRSLDESTAKNARFFVIKSYSEDDIHRAIKYGVWCSTEHGNKRLDAAFKERDGKGPIYLFYSVNSSGHFCGMAQMMSGVDYTTHAGVWTQDKWKGSMEIKWIYVKDVPNAQLRHIRLENNENKPVTNSRDTQEIPCEKGKQVLKIIHSYRHSTSLFDDFGHYEKKEVEENGDNSNKRKTVSAVSMRVVIP